MMEKYFEILVERLKELLAVLTGNAIPSIKENARKKIIDLLTVEHDGNWQCVATPYDICNEMIDLIPPDTEQWVVMFSMEMLEMLKAKGIPENKILFVADNEYEEMVAQHDAIYNVKTLVFNKTNNAKNIGTVIKNFLNEETMKFNKLAVIGNPPYQMQTEAQEKRTGGKQQAIAIYHLFVESVIDNLSPDYLSMIIPSRWMVGGMGLEKHRDRMMNDTRMKKIVHFAGEREVFPTVSIKGGVNYFLWEKNYNGECEFCHGNTSIKRLLNRHDIILQDNNAFGILEKVMNTSSKFINQTCYGNKPFGLATNFKNWVEPATNGDLNGHIHGIDISICYSTGKQINSVKMTDFSDKHGIIGKWKVCTSKATSEGNINPDKTGAMSIATNLFIIEPTAICTETYIVVNVFDTKQEAENFISYMKTKFFRFMLGLRVLTQDINKEKFAWVPDVLDYSSPWTDKELYKKFNLSRQEIAYIESKIKAI